MPASRPGFACIWEYVVRRECNDAFEATYGPDGPWVALFSRAPDYLGTELHRDRNDPQRYLTIDYWASAEAFGAFRGEMAAEYEAIDAQCEDLTATEREIGRLEPVG